MKLTKLTFPEHPRPPQRELRQRGVFDSDGTLIGYVANVYVDDEGNYRFVDVATGGFMGWLGKKHRLLPVEAVAEVVAVRPIRGAPEGAAGGRGGGSLPTGGRGGRRAGEDTGGRGQPWSGAIGRMRLGSVSTKVVHAAKGPVLVHPPLQEGYA